MRMGVCKIELVNFSVQLFPPTARLVSQSHIHHSNKPQTALYAAEST